MRHAAQTFGTTENPRVAGSIPALGTPANYLYKSLYYQGKGRVGAAVASMLHQPLTSIFNDTFSGGVMDGLGDRIGLRA